MGFDYVITIEMTVDPESGKLYSWSYTNLEKIFYDPEKHAIPQNLRKYTHGRGYLFGLYIKSVVDDLDTEPYSITTNDLLDSYPPWEDLQENCNEVELDMWTEEDHEGLKSLCQWLKTMGFTGRMSYSY